MSCPSYFPKASFYDKKSIYKRLVEKGPSFLYIHDGLNMATIDFVNMKSSNVMGGVQLSEVVYFHEYCDKTASGSAV